jgi:asparagine synthase (glutamine-hydrolysing)
MQDILPAEIQWRRDKLDFAPHVIRGMLARHRALLDGILLNDADGVGAFVHAPEVNAAYRRIIENAEGADGGDVQIVWRTAVLSLWLRRLNRSPSDRAAA